MYSDHNFFFLRSGDCQSLLAEYRNRIQLKTTTNELPTLILTENACSLSKRQNVLEAACEEKLGSFIETRTA